MNNICISYCFDKENLEVIDHVFVDTVVDGDDVLSSYEEDEDKYQHDYDNKRGDDYDDDNDQKGDSLYAKIVVTSAPSSQSDLSVLTLIPEKILDNFKIENKEKKVTQLNKMSNYVRNI